MFKVNGEITEKIEYCRHLASGSVQILNDKERADSMWVNGKLLPLDSKIEQFSIVEYLSNKLNGVTEDDIPET